MATAASG